jgi:hypothetical protein
MSNKVKYKFWCNAGHTEEEVEIEVDEHESEGRVVYEAFIKWLDNNEQCGFDKL